MIMTVGKLIERLQEFDRDLPVTLTDGHECTWYNLGKAEFELCVEGRRSSLDIGIGGCKSNAETLGAFLKEARKKKKDEEG